MCPASFFPLSVCEALLELNRAAIVGFPSGLPCCSVQSQVLFCRFITAFFFYVELNRVVRMVVPHHVAAKFALHISSYQPSLDEKEKDDMNLLLRGIREIIQRSSQLAMICQTTGSRRTAKTTGFCIRTRRACIPRCQDLSPILLLTPRASGQSDSSATSA